MVLILAYFSFEITFTYIESQFVDIFMCTAMLFHSVFIRVYAHVNPGNGECVEIYVPLYVKGVPKNLALLVGMWTRNHL